MSPVPGPPCPSDGFQLFACRHASPPPPEPPDHVQVAACRLVAVPSAQTASKGERLPVIFTAPRCGQTGALCMERYAGRHHPHTWCGAMRVLYPIAPGSRNRLNSASPMESMIAVNESSEAHHLLMQKLAAAAIRCGAEGKHLALFLIELAPRGEFAANGNRTDTETIFRELLRAVQAHCGRDNDWVLRVSNERIAAACPDTHAAGASHIAARIREAAFFLPSRRGLPLPLAIGVAVTGPGSGESADDILTRAQRTLEAARNQTASLLSIRGAGSPPAQRPSLFAWAKDLFGGSSASPGRRLGE